MYVMYLYLRNKWNVSAVTHEEFILYILMYKCMYVHTYITGDANNGAANNVGFKAFLKSDVCTLLINITRGGRAGLHF